MSKHKQTKRGISPIVDRGISEAEKWQTICVEAGFKPEEAPARNVGDVMQALKAAVKPEDRAHDYRLEDMKRASGELSQAFLKLDNLRKDGRLPGDVSEIGQPVLGSNVIVATTGHLTIPMMLRGLGLIYGFSLDKAEAKKLAMALLAHT